MINLGMKRNSAILITAALFVPLIMASCSKQDLRKNPYFQSQLINTDHLNHLCEDAVVNGDSVSIVHIYADYPAYKWVDAGSEGIACVDDGARAAIVYLNLYDLSGDVSALNRAKKLLNFVMALQSNDGEFYNFINSDYTINKTGRTSRKSFDFWAARGYWALARGYSVFRDKDREYGSLLKERFLRCRMPIRKLLKRYGEYESINGRKYPLWLINRFGSDAVSEFLLGMAQYLRVEKDTELEGMTEKMVRGVLDMQLGDDEKYPGAFLSWKGVWHAYANCQVQALAELSIIMDKPSWLNAAKKGADLFYPKLIKRGNLYSIKMGKMPVIKTFPVIAYGVRPVVSGLINLSEATGERTYAVRAGLAAAWFFGRNRLKAVMYDVNTGRCFDGINDFKNINLNSGAESTIEALMCLLDVASHRKAFEELEKWKKENGKSAKRNLSSDE